MLEIGGKAFFEWPEARQLDALRRQLAEYGHRRELEIDSLHFDGKFPDWKTRDLSELLSAMKTQQYYITCGRLNYLLMRIYQHFGWQAATYNFGLPHTSLTHELVLVELKNRQMMVQDAYFNSSLWDDEHPASFFEFLKAVKTGDTADYYFKEDTALVQLYLANVPGEFVQYRAGFLGGPVSGDSLIYNFIVVQQLLLQDSCYGFMSIVRKLEPELTYMDLFLNRVSDLNGDLAERWQISVDSVLIYSP